MEDAEIVRLFGVVDWYSGFMVQGFWIVTKVEFTHEYTDEAKKRILDAVMTKFKYNQTLKMEWYRTESEYWIRLYPVKSSWFKRGVRRMRSMLHM
jgi:hypothetical protein